jgi:hypothetical protein
LRRSHSQLYSFTERPRDREVGIVPLTTGPVAPESGCSRFEEETRLAAVGGSLRAFRVTDAPFDQDDARVVRVD